MFSTCLFCHGALGANDTIEHFPVGKRLAFDGERGRLWAVCPHCARWNLAPIEERWEALEECEKAYRAATKRVSTDNIALARLKDGTDLVRIGQPLLPEYAAWRYSRTFLRRTYWATARRSVPGALLNGAGTFAVAKATGAASATALIAMPAIGIISMFAAGGLLVWRHRQPNALLLSHDGGMHGVARADVGGTRITHDADAGLALRLKTRVVRPTGRIRRALGIRAVPANAEPANETTVTGDEATFVLGQVLALINAFDASGQLVKEAIERAERYQSPSTDVPSAIAVLAPRIAGYRGSLFGTGESIGSLSPVNRLAAEMALHEDDERRALAGELGALYARWEEAERTAAIADTMFVPTRHSEPK
jgi:hypothetical protein